MYQLLEEANRMKFTEPQKALEIINFVYVQSLKSADEKLEAISLYMLGVSNELISNYPQAIKFLSEAIKLAQTLGEKKIMADSLNVVGIINDKLNNYSNALKAYFRSLKFYEELGLNKNIAIVLSNIGLIYTNINDYRNALKFYSQALDIAEEENDNESRLVTSINIGLTHKLLGNYNDALRFLGEALDIASEKNDKHRKSLALDLIGDVKSHLKDYTGAHENLSESLKMKIELDDRRGQAVVLATIGNLLLSEEKLEEAKENLESALKISSNLGMKKSIYENNKLIAEIYEKQNNNELALKHLRSAYEKELEYLREEAEVKAKNISTQLEIEQAQKEAEIQRLKNIELAKALEDVKQLNVSLNGLNEEKNEFMAIAVHDLKNPLQNILSTARVIKRSKDLSGNELDDFTSNIISQTDRMFNLIKKLLDHNAIEQGNIKVKNSSFSINELCHELINNFKDEASKKSLNLLYEENTPEATLYLDKDLLYEVLQNLLSNSIKFSQPGKNIYLRINENKPNIIIEIIDEGPGFTEKDKEKIFTKFARLSAKPTGDEHSTGLGLSIVKRLCEMIGADISLQSEEGKGAKFIISVKIPE
jgi:signal transduction histidine kinase